MLDPVGAHAFHVVASSRPNLCVFSCTSTCGYSILRPEYTLGNLAPLKARWIEHLGGPAPERLDVLTVVAVIPSLHMLYVGAHHAKNRLAVSIRVVSLVGMKHPSCQTTSTS